MQADEKKKRLVKTLNQKNKNKNKNLKSAIIKVNLKKRITMIEKIIKYLRTKNKFLINKNVIYYNTSNILLKKLIKKYKYIIFFSFIFYIYI